MASSPTESVPSLGEVSQTSSETNNDDDVRRKLFQTPELVQTKQWESMITDIASPFKPSGPESPKFGSTFDLKSAAMDKAQDPSPYDPVSTEEEKKSHTPLKNSVGSSVDEDEDDCYTPLSPPQRTSVKQLVSLFSVFDGLQPASHWPQLLPPTKSARPLEEASPSKEQGSLISDTHATTVVDTANDENKWKKKAANLERECNALQGIVCTDSVNMTKLKREVTMLRESNGQHISEISLLSSTLKTTVDKLELLERTKEEQEDREVARLETIRVLKEEIQRLKEEHEENESANMETITVLKEELERIKEEKEDREVAHVETIKVLKNEVERLSETRLNACDKCPSEDLVRLQYEHELFAMQILCDERTLKEARENMVKQDNLILQLKQRMEVMRARLVSMEPLHTKAESLESEKERLSSDFAEKLKSKDNEICELKKALEKARELAQRKKKMDEEEALNGSKLTEIHLAETEQHLETTLQLLKEQEQQIWHLEERIFQLTPHGKQAPKKPPSSTPALWCAS